jgi:hypothetical protein
MLARVSNISNRIDYSGLDAFRMYLAIRMHFAPNSKYDYFKYSGKTNASPASFQKRADINVFRKLERQYNKDELLNLFVANFVNDSDSFSRDMLTDNAHKIYKSWLTRKLAQNYHFAADLDTICEEMDKKGLTLEQMAFVDNNHPPLMQLLLANRIAIDSLVMIDAFAPFVDYWASKLDDIISDNVLALVNNYRPFVQFDKAKTRSTIKNKLLKINDQKTTQLV